MAHNLRLFAAAATHGRSVERRHGADVLRPARLYSTWPGGAAAADNARTEHVGAGAQELSGAASGHSAFDGRL